MKKQKQDSQKASELLRKLQEAVLSSQKKEDASEDPDSDELAFQQKIAGMLSRVTPQTEATGKKKKQKATKKKSPPPLPIDGEANEEPIEEEISSEEIAIDESIDSESIIEETVVEEASEIDIVSPSVEAIAHEEETTPPPSTVKQTKRTRAKKQALHQKNVKKADEAIEIEPVPASAETVVEEDPAIASTVEAIAEEPDVASADEAIEEETIPLAEELPMEETVAEEISSSLQSSEEAEEEIASVIQPSAPQVVKKAVSRTSSPMPQRTSARVISPKQSEPPRRERDPDTIVITPKSNLKSTVPIVIKPNRSQRTADPIRVEVKKPMPKAPKIIPSPSTKENSAVASAKDTGESVPAKSAKVNPQRRITPSAGAPKRTSSAFTPRVPKGASNSTKSRTSNKTEADDKRRGVALENVLFDNSTTDAADAEYSLRKSTTDGKSAATAMLSTPEILKYTEKKTGLTPDDVSMILELGYEQELSRLIGRDALKKLKAEHVREKRPVDKLRYLTAFGYRNQEYTGEQSRDVILANYAHDKKSLLLRLALTALVTILLLSLEIPMLFGELFVANLGNMPAILFPLLSLMGLILATALSHKSMRAGIRSFFRISPTPYSVAALLCMVAIPAGLVNLFLVGGDKNFISLNLPAVIALLITAICDAARLFSEMKVFRILSAEDEKAVLEPAEPQKQKLRQGDKIVRIINDDVDQNIYCIRKSNLVSGFFRRCNDTSSAPRPFGFLLLTALTLSFLTGFVSAVCGKDFSAVTSAVLLTFFFSLPIPAVVLYFFPLCHANRLLTHRNCALIGEESVSEYSQPKTVIYRDKDMYAVKKCTQIMTREGEDFRRDMHLAAILFRKMRGALGALDPHSDEKAASDPAVTFVRLGENGTEAMVDNRYHLLAGDAKFMTKNGVRIPKDRAEDTNQSSENTCLMYLAINGSLKLIYEIEYEASASFERMTEHLSNFNTRLAIRTFDPNLNDAFLEQSRERGAEYVRVIKPTQHESDGTMEVSDSGAIALGGRFDLPRTMIAASVIHSIRFYGYRIQLATAILGASLALLLTFLQSNLQNGVSLLIALLFQGVITAAAWLATRLVFRFGASENLK